MPKQPQTMINITAASCFQRQRGTEGLVSNWYQTRTIQGSNNRYTYNTREYVRIYSQIQYIDTKCT